VRREDSGGAVGGRRVRDEECGGLMEQDVGARRPEWQSSFGRPQGMGGGRWGHGWGLRMVARVQNSWMVGWEWGLRCQLSSRINLGTCRITHRWE
jgi:hypothetical protein